MGHLFLAHGDLDVWTMDKSRTNVLARVFFTLLTRMQYKTFAQAYKAQQTLHDHVIQDDPLVCLKAVFMDEDEGMREIARIDAENDARIEAAAKAQMPVLAVKEESTGTFFLVTYFGSIS